MTIIFVLGICSVFVCAFMVFGYFLFDSIKGSIIGGFIAILLIVTLVGMTCFEDKTDDKVWNNGVCPSCGQHWEFKNGSPRGYFYSCDNCHINIQLAFLR